MCKTHLRSLGHCLQTPGMESSEGLRISALKTQSCTCLHFHTGRMLQNTDADLFQVLEPVEEFGVDVMIKVSTRKAETPGSWGVVTDRPGLPEFRGGGEGREISYPSPEKRKWANSFIILIKYL